MPPSLLMENAGEALANKALALGSARGNFAVLCGRGNNGGDGLVAARKLLEAGRAVQVQVVGSTDKLSPELQRNLLSLQGLGFSLGIAADAELGEGDVAIDALFGTGLSRSPEAEYAQAIRRMSEWQKRGARVVSADIPSGLSADDGKPFGSCVSADATVAFGCAKWGHVLEPGASLCGELAVAPIGLPSIDQLPPSSPPAWLLEESDIRALLPRRAANSHKGTYGHVLVVGGSPGKTGAAALAGVAALRAGAGLATIAASRATLSEALAHAPELMGYALPEGPLGLAHRDLLLRAAEDKSAVVIGPGLDVGPETHALLKALFQQWSLPCVVDADALNASAGDVALFAESHAPLLLTPHPGEMGRLLSIPTQEVQAHRLSSVRALAARAQAVVALKGARTLIAAPDGEVWVNPTGNPGMATGGTGDVLAGICGALLAQKLSLAHAAVASVYVHGLAADIEAARRGQAGLLASDLWEGLCAVWSRWNL